MTSVTPAFGPTLVKDISITGSVYWHIFDESGRSSWHFLDFIIASVDEARLSPKTVETRAYSIFKFYQYLSKRSVDFWSSDDKLLKEFRDLRVSTFAKNCIGESRARMRSVNQELRCIYIFFAWLQSDSHYGAGNNLLGPAGHQIKSSLLLRTTSAKAARRIRGSDRFPLCFRNAGERSKHRVSFVPENRHRRELVAYFYSNFDPVIARRNCLMFELAWTVGWRRGSIISLTIEDFNQLKDDATADLWVKPKSQKFGYSNAFIVPHRIAAQVNDFISRERPQLVREEAESTSALFLSSKTGRPLATQSASAIFGKARLVLGWPHGAGLHSWRRGFANQYIGREIDARLELGLDTSGETIALSLASALGHESTDSQQAYIRDSQRRLRSSDSFAVAEEIATLHDEIARLTTELQRLTQANSGS